MAYFFSRFGFIFLLISSFASGFCASPHDLKLGSYATTLKDDATSDDSGKCTIKTPCLGDHSNQSLPPAAEEEDGNSLESDEEV